MLIFDVNTDHKGRFEGFTMRLDDENGCCEVWSGSWDLGYAVDEAERVLALMKAIGLAVRIDCDLHGQGG